ncbi:ABC transporter ATP-binding protein [Leptothermofonsia sp. ETS-13]|uniref:ABC transporter ATP-binding protein n=1 Tax=Leptothermofonsia sp. ETS-13 TaxID=3035696 RepID=UPI003BA10DCB
MLKYLSKFLYITAERKSRLLFLLCLFLTTGILDAVGIGLIGPFIALANEPQTIRQNTLLNWAYIQSGLSSEAIFISLLGLCILGVFYLKSFSFFWVQKYIYKFSYSLQASLRLRLLRSYLTVPYTFHLSRSSPGLIQNILEETSNFCQAVAIPLLNSISNAIVILIIFLLLAKTNALATLAVLVIPLLAFFPYYHFRQKIEYWGREGSKASAEMVRVVNHSLGGIKETRVIGCEAFFEQQMEQQVERQANASYQFSTFKLLPRIMIEVLVITFLVVLTSIFLFSQSSQNFISVLGIFAMASIRLMPSINYFTSIFGVLRYSSYTVDKLYFDLKELEEQRAEKHLLSVVEAGVDRPRQLKQYCDDQVVSFTKDITIQNLSYRYPDTPEPALRSISLKIKKGQSIGLIGKSGAGKTTLVDVILGLLKPESGDILVDGASIYSNLRAWQNLLGYIPQSIFLAEDTIERNIAFGVPDELIDSKKMEEAIQAAQLTELVKSLPDGIKTSIGERGVRLSGGQRQRIGIARVLYHGREILVLDEATAALDNETESLVSEAIQSLSGRQTLIIIAHRLTTIEKCDCIYVVDKGRIVRSGSYKEVVPVAPNNR